MVFLVILIASFLLQMVLPWWVVIIISFVTCGLIGKTGRIAFWSPFFAILLLWIGFALFKSIPNQNILAGRVAEMFAVKYWMVVLILTGLLGGLASAISGLCGYHFRKAILHKKTSS